jgi:hypothetical protein
LPETGIVLLSERRRSLIFLCMAGMEAAWITPFVLLLFRPPAPSVQETRPMVVYAIVLAGLLAWVLMLELLGRSELASPLYEVLAFGVMLIAGLVAVRVLLYRQWPLADFGWLPQIARDILQSPGGFPPAIAVFLTNLFLWHRATTATGREISFFSVGASFRRGLLLLITGAGLYAYVRGSAPLSLLWVYLGCGLSAVSLARIDEKARAAQSAGAPLPARRMVQLAAAITVTVAGIAAISRFYTQDGFITLLRGLAPVWRLVEPVVVGVLLFVARLLDPILRWMEAFLRSLMAGRGLPPISEIGPAGPPEGQQALSQDLPYWLTDLLPRILATGIILLGVVIFVGFLFLWIERSRRRAGGAQREELEAFEPGGFGLGSLRDRVLLARRYGVGRQLLAAVSVENIYANICRLARRRGYGRAPSQPPDAYLPVLERAFGGHGEELGRITTAYMRVHYGDRPVTPDELAAIREAYRALRESYGDPRQVPT